MADNTVRLNIGHAFYLDLSLNVVNDKEEDLGQGWGVGIAHAQWEMGGA